MAIIDASLNDFNIKVKNNLELAYNHMEKVVELSDNISVVGNGNKYDELIDIFDDFKDIKYSIEELEDWSLSTLVRTKDMLFGMLNEANKLPSFYILDREKLSR